MSKIQQIITKLLTEGKYLSKDDDCGCGCNTCHLPKTNLSTIKEQIKPIIRQILSENFDNLYKILTSKEIAGISGSVNSDKVTIHFKDKTKHIIPKKDWDNFVANSG